MSQLKGNSIQPEGETEKNTQKNKGKTRFKTYRERDRNEKRYLERYRRIETARGLETGKDTRKRKRQIMIAGGTIIGQDSSNNYKVHIS